MKAQASASASRRLGRDVVGPLLLLLGVRGASAGAPSSLEELRRFFDYDPKQPLEAKLTLLYERSGASTYDLIYASPKGGMVTGYLVSPKGKGPVRRRRVRALGTGRPHGVPAGGRDLRRGRRRLCDDRQPMEPPSALAEPQGQGLGEPEKDRDSWINAVVDLRRAIDLLAARPDVDAGRIGYVGHSYGAQWGAILSAVDDRVRAAALLGGVADVDAIVVDSDDPDRVALRGRHSKQELERYLEVNRPFDGIRWVPHAAPTPLLFQFARHERYFNEASMKRYLAAASEPKEVRWYDTGHDLNDPRALADRAAWLAPKLGLAPVQPILEKRIR